jgi:hypothetical protein
MQTIFKTMTGRPEAAWHRPLRILARLRILMEIPIGYQDQTGFHFGIQSQRECWAAGF